MSSVRTRVTLKVKPGSAKTGFAGRYGDAWKLNVAAPPVDGKANEAIVRYLAGLLKVPASSVRIVTGQTGSMKIVEIVGIDAATLERVILGQ